MGVCKMEKNMNIYGVRRFGILLLIFILGLILGSLNSKLIAILSIPLLLLWFFSWDEVSYKRNSLKTKRGN